MILEDFEEKFVRYDERDFLYLLSIEKTSIPAVRFALWNSFGRFYSNLNRHEKAIWAFTEAIKIFPKHPYPRYCRTVQYLKIHNYKKAFVDLTVILENDQKYLHLHNTVDQVRALCFFTTAMDKYLHQGIIFQAKEELKKGIELIKKTDEWASSFLGIFLKYIEIDEDFYSIMYPKNVYDLKKDAECLLNRIKNIYDKETEYLCEKIPDASIWAFLLLSIKQNIFELLVDVLNEKKLKKKYLDEIRKVLEEFPFSKCYELFNHVEILLRRMIEYKTLDNMQTNWDKIRELTPALEFADGILTREIAKNVSSFLLPSIQGKLDNIQKENIDQYKTIQEVLGKLQPLSEGVVTGLTEPMSQVLKHFITDYKVEIKPGPKRAGLLIINNKQIKISAIESDICMAMGKQSKDDWQNIGERDHIDIGWVSFEAFRKTVSKWVNIERKGEKVINDTVIINAINRLNKKNRKALGFKKKQKDLIENGAYCGRAKSYRFKVYPKLITIE